MGDFEEGLANLERSIPIFRELNRNFFVQDTLRLLGKNDREAPAEQRSRS